MDRINSCTKNNLVSEVVTYPGLNMNERYIHCKIDGERQLAKKLSKEDNKNLDKVIEIFRTTKNWGESRAFLLALAEKYYKDEILQALQGQVQSNGLKR